MDTRAYRLAVPLAGLYLLLGVGVYGFGNQSPVDAGRQLLGHAGGGALVALWVGTAAFGGLLWALSRAGSIPDRLGPIAPWLLPAVVGPIGLYPVATSAGDVALIAVAILWPIAVLPLGLAIGASVRGRRTIPLVASGVAAAVAIALGLVPLELHVVPPALLMLRFLAAVSVVAMPGLALLKDSRESTTLTTASSATSRVLAGAAVIVACIMPAIAGAFLLLPWDLALELALAAFAGGGLAARVAVRPLARVAARANTQRDLSVAVSEAERSRLAADLHDGPLQEILLLARRLESDGDPENAALAREIGADLRELSGDLRLPMLDDLGVGPALEWLVARARRLTGLDISLRYEAEGRPPPDVELATFRIAQEAITNAVRHGQPPVVVHCRTSGTALSLSVEDAGPTRQASRGSAPRPAGRFGLVNKQQRAEQVGARLEFRLEDASGTTVVVEWRAGAVAT